MIIFIVYRKIELTFVSVDFACSCSGTHLLSQLKNICRVRIALHSSLTGWFSNKNEDFGSRRNCGCSTNGCISKK